jgi:LuxR family maltose regulon positive regulatory protein
MLTTIILVEDHLLFRNGLRLLLEEEAGLRVVGEAGNGETAFALVQELSPDVVLMDIGLPDVDGIEATRRILAEYPAAKVMALSIHADTQFIDAMFQAGAVGYVLKEAASEELVAGLQAVTRGEIYLSHGVKDVMVTQYIDQLTSDSDADVHADTLLITKLHRPQIPHPLVLRSRLLEQLEQERERPLILISAPAGYGKSTLVSQWLETYDRPSAWLSLDKTDNDLRQFLTYFIAAVQTQFPETLPRSSDFLLASSLPPLPIIANTMINELQNLPRPLIMVLDDCHRIDLPVIFEFLSLFLRHPPRTLHLVLVTRSDPMLNLLRLRAGGQMGEVRARALSFTAEETADFLQGAWGRTVEASVATAVTDKFEGWAAGLRLLALSFRGGTDLDYMVKTMPGKQRMLDYLVAEVVSNQPPEIQAWLLKTAILDRFCAPLCEAVCTPVENQETSSFNGDEFIQWLTENNLFVISLDHQNHWFRTHHLFRELLRDKLKNKLATADIAALHARASTWFASNDLIEEAIGHALLSGDEAAAAQVVENNRLAALNADKWYMLSKWLDSLPEKIKQERPPLLLAQAQILLQTTRVAEILPVIDRVESLLGDDDHAPELLAESAYFRGIVSYFQGDGARSEACLNEAATLLPTRYSSIFEGQIKYWLALALYLNGRGETAVQKLEEDIRERNARAGMITSRLSFGLCFIHMLAGAWSEVLQEGLRLKEISTANALSFSDTWANYVLGYASLQIFDLDSARHALTLVMENRYIANYRAVVDAMIGLALALQFMGEANEADEIMQQAQEFAAWTPDPGNLQVARSGQARLALLRDDYESAGRWQRSLSETSTIPVMLFFIENSQITQCRVLIAMGSDANLQEAADKLLQLQTVNDAAHNLCQMVEITILQAIVLSGQGHLGEALRLLEKAVAMAVPSGLLRPFIEASHPLADLLVLLKESGVAGGAANQIETLSYIDQILAAIPATTLSAAPISQPTSQAGLIDPLTKRELEIMRLLATRLDTREIASQLHIQRSTLHTHKRNIYSKLDVHSRKEAVDRVLELGLI